MADGTGEITIERSLDQIKQGIADIGTASKAIDKDLKAVNAGLKFDPSNTELLAQKQELLSQKLENSKDRSQELSVAIAELNRIKTENGQLTDGQSKLLETYQQQLKNTSAEITGLTGNVEKQIEVNKSAEESTKSFSESMTEFQSNLRAVNQVMGGVNNAFKLFGGDPNSTMGLFIKQGQEAVKMMSGIASAGKLLGKANEGLGQTFGTLAISAAAAFAAFNMVDGLLNGLDGKARTVASAIATLTAAVAIGTVAWMAFHGTMTLGLAVPIILAAVGAGIAGIKGMLPKKESAGDYMPTALGVTTSNSSTASALTASTPESPRASTPSVPTYSGGGSVQSQTIVQTLSQRQIEDAVYSSVTRIVLEQGLNEPTVIDKTSITLNEIRRWIFSGILDPQTGTINAREVL